MSIWNSESVAQFWSHVRRTESCWLWTGAMQRHGYGVINRRGKMIAAHRFSWALANGLQLPMSEQDVCHHCDTPACVRPEHLFLGTAKDNMADAAAKQRTSVGVKHYLAKLNPVAVQEIRALRVAHVTYREIAERFHVSYRTVHQAVNGRSWKHVA